MFRLNVVIAINKINFSFLRFADSGLMKFWDEIIRFILIIALAWTFRKYLIVPGEQGPVGPTGPAGPSGPKGSCECNLTEVSSLKKRLRLLEGERSRHGGPVLLSHFYLSGAFYL